MNRSFAWILHPLVWLAIIAIPLFVTRPNAPMVTTEQYLHFLLSSVALMAVFYCNYFILIKKLLFCHRFALYILSNIVLIVFMMVVTRFISIHMLPTPDFMNHMPGPPAGDHGHMFPPDGIFPPSPGRKPYLSMLKRELGNLSINILVVGASVAIKSTTEWFKTNSEMKEVEKSRTEAELQNLKSQLNPHFLFNTLNNIYSLVQIDTDKAQDAIMDLSKVLRYVLYDTSENKVLVKSDINFVSEFISLMRMRLNSSTSLKVNLPDENSPVMNKEIAPLLFISIIENAFKHGISDGGKSIIDIDIHESGNSIVCHVTNTNNPKKDDDRSGSGIGLDNLTKRLELLYPGKHSFTYGVNGEIFESTLTVNLD